MNVLQYLATKELNLLTYNSSLLNISSFQIIKKNLKPAWKRIESVWNYNFFGSRRREFRLSSRCMKSESEGAGREPNLPVDIPSLANERGLLPFRCCSCSSCCSEVAGWSIRTRIWSSDVRQISFLLRNSPCPSPPPTAGLCGRQPSPRALCQCNTKGYGDEDPFGGPSAAPLWGLVPAR